MARILFGVMGDALGHVSRALAIARDMTGHEFLFLGGGKVLTLKELGYPVEEVPVPATYYSDNSVNVLMTIQNGIKVLLNRKRTIEKVKEIIKDFRPDLVLTDYEYFSPMAARSLGIRSISIDHQHFLTKCLFNPPKGQTLGRLLLTLPLQLMYSHADKYLITSFFNLPVKNPKDDEIFPPILRQEVKKVAPVVGDHVLVYQTSPTFHRLLPVLKRLPSQCILYGLGGLPASKNLIYKAHSNRGFLKDLASCLYVVTNGGHNVISEALFLGKPVFSFPIHLAYEQFINAQMLRHLGYGDYSLDPSPDLGLFEDFERRLDKFRSRISEVNFWGNDRIIERLKKLI